MERQAIRNYIGDAKHILSNFAGVAREFAIQEAEDRGMHKLQAYFFVRSETRRIVALAGDFKAAIRQTRNDMQDPYLVLARVVETAPRDKITMKDILTANRFFQRLERHAH